jgi:serine/threonine protein phosphatase PrpC
MNLRAGVASDRGLVRPANEDSFLLRRGLYAVCDGMGGARAGEVASEMACLGLVSLDPASSGKKELRTAVVNTNQAIVSRSLAEDHLLGMGTTLTAAMFKDGSLILAHVGDSRAYLFRDGDLVQLTNDHSWVGEMVRRGELTAEQAAVHPHRSVITRALGTDREVEPDVKEVEVAEGDRILLCSDGLTGMVSDEQIAALLAGTDAPQAAADALAKAALAGGGEDNVTVVVVDVMPGEGPPPDPGEGDHLGEGILVGPTDRGALSNSPLQRGRRAGAAVRERLGRRTAPVVRPVAEKPGWGGSAAGGSRPAGTPAVGRETSGTGATASPEATVTEATVTEAPPAPEAPPAMAIPLAAQGLAGQAPSRGRRRRRWLITAIAVVVVLAAALGGFAAYNSSVYYVGKYDDGSVALYRGLPGSFVGIGLSSVVEVVDVEYDLLASYMQGRVDAHDLVSKEEGRAFLKALDEQQ